MVVTPPLHVTTNVTGTNAPESSSRMSWAGLSMHRDTRPTVDALSIDDPRPDQLVHPQRVVAVVDERLGEQDRVGQLLRRGAIVDTVEVDQPTLLAAAHATR